MLYLNFSSVVDKNALVVGTGGGSVSPFSSHKFSIHTDSNSCRFFHFAVPLTEQVCIAFPSLQRNIQSRQTKRIHVPHSWFPSIEYLKILLENTEQCSNCLWRWTSCVLANPDHNSMKDSWSFSSRIGIIYQVHTIWGILNMPLRYFPLHFTSFLLCSIDLEFYNMCHQFPVHCHCDSDPLASLCALKAINCFVFTLYGFYMFLQVRSRQRCQWIAT